MRIFDTTFIVDLVNSDPGAVELAEKQSKEDTPAIISAITLHEYLFGVRLRYGKSPELERKLASANRDLAPFDVLPLTKDVAELSSKLHADLTAKGKQIGIKDVYIGATALRCGLDLVSRNRSHFSQIPSLKVLTY